MILSNAIAASARASWKPRQSSHSNEAAHDRCHDQNRHGAENEREESVMLVLRAGVV